MAYYHDTDANVATLARLFGFEPLAARAWLRCEAQGVDNPTNPLNIEAGGVTAGAQVGSVGGFAVFSSAGAGLAAAHDVVATLAPKYGYGAILAQRGSGDPYAQARAVERSDWAAGHYTSTATRDGCLARYVTQNGGDMQLSDKVKVPDWAVKRWPDATFLQDGEVSVEQALGAGYALSRKAAQNTDALVATLAAQQATIDALVKAAAAGGVDAATLKADVQAAIDSAVSRITVQVGLSPDA